MTEFEKNLGDVDAFVDKINNSEEFLPDSKAMELNGYYFCEIICENSMSELPCSITLADMPIKIIETFYDVDEYIDYNKGEKNVIFSVYDECFRLTANGSSWIDEKDLVDWEVRRVRPVSVTRVEYEDIK